MSSPLYKKGFNQEDFKKADPETKETAKKFIEKNISGSRVINNPYTEFGIDLFVCIPTAEANLYDQHPLEVECRWAWKSKLWNFGDRVRVPARKLKFNGSNFMILNSDKTSAILIPAGLKPKVTFEKTKLSSYQQEEMFLVFSFKECVFMDLTSDKKQTLKF